MAKKPGLMNDPKHVGGGMLNVANVMAKAAHFKAQSKGKAYIDGEDSDDNGAMPDKGPGDKQDPSKDGAKHPSAPSAKPSQYAGEQHDEMCDGAQHPSASKSNKSRSQIAAIKEKSKK